jgi:hypothetical protein
VEQQEQNITEDELEARLVIQIVLVSSEDIKDTVNN